MFLTKASENVCAVPEQERITFLTAHLAGMSHLTAVPPCSHSSSSPVFCNSIFPMCCTFLKVIATPDNGDLGPIYPEVETFVIRCLQLSFFVRPHVGVLCLTPADGAGVNPRSGWLTWDKTYIRVGMEGNSRGTAEFGRLQESKRVTHFNLTGR